MGVSRVSAVPGRPASLTYESPSEKSVILYWTPPDETNGILLGYTVQYYQGEVGKREVAVTFRSLVKDGDLKYQY